MKRLLVPLVALLLWAGAAPAWADIVELKDGTKREGRIVEEATAYVKLEIEKSGMKAVITIHRKDIKRIQKGAVDLSKSLPPMEYYEKMAATLGEDAAGWFDLGMFCKEKELYGPAKKCLEKAVELDDSYRSRAREHLYEIEVFRTRECRERLEEALKTLQGGRVVTALGQLQAFREEFADVDLGSDPATQSKFIEQGYPELGAAYGKDLAAMITAVEAKAARICQTCEGRTFVECPDCQGTGDARCAVCEGEKEVNCENCKGTAEQKCSACKGFGVTERYEGRKRVREDCKTCKTTGLEKCSECKNGKIECELCKGKGQVKGGCETCEAKKKIPCKACEGTGEKDPNAGEGEGKKRRKFGEAR